MIETRTRKVLRPAMAPEESPCLRGFLAEGVFCGAVCEVALMEGMATMLGLAPSMKLAWEMEKLERS